MGRPSKYPPEFRREVVELVVTSGRPRVEVARGLGISADLAREAERYRKIFNTIRPHEALYMARPRDVYLTAIPNFPDPETEPET